MTAKKRKPLDSLEQQFVYNAQEPERTPAAATPEPTPTPPKPRKLSSQQRKQGKYPNQEVASFSERTHSKVHRRSARIAAP